MKKIIPLTLCCLVSHIYADLEYTFETGREGWFSVLESTDVANSFAQQPANSLLRLTSYGISVPAGSNPFRDDVQNCGLLFRSPEFQFVDTQNAAISFQMGGGSVNNSAAPSTDSDSVLTNASSSTGYTGLLLRNVNSGAYVIASENPNYSASPARVITWSSSTLSGLIHSQDRYTLDLVDLRHGPWGWLSLDDVLIAGASAISELYATNNTPIVWLEQLGYTNNFDQAAVADPDMDNFANWQEYQADTNPTNSTDFLAIEIDVTHPTFESSTNCIYTIEWCNNLSSNNWNRLTNNISGTGGNITITDTNRVAIRFYRLCAERK